ncbi:MAG: alpha/beta hydrolase [Bacteroidaceae bacterium]|nr:alpha/beta hydrolase [Bacteroidaceae bacterium]
MKKKRKILVCGLLTVVCCLVLAIVGGAFYMLDYSLNPAGKEQRDAKTNDFLRERYDGLVEWIDSMQAVGALRDTFIVNDKGLRLHALYASCDSAQGTAVLVHGFTDNARRMMMFGRVYRDSLHFNIIAPEHQRHGKSEGSSIQMGWLDRLDIERWISVADSLWPSSPIYLHGLSMGGATVMMCSGDSLLPSVRGIIEDCGYTSVWDEFAGEIKNQFHLPPHPLMDVASLLCQWRYGWNFREASSLEQVRRSTLPMLFIHGENDTFVPTAMVHPLYEAKTKGYKRLWLAPGSEHARSFHDHPQEYFKEMKNFINKTKQ